MKATFTITNQAIFSFTVTVICQSAVERPYGTDDGEVSAPTRISDRGCVVGHKYRRPRIKDRDDGGHRDRETFMNLLLNLRMVHKDLHAVELIPRIFHHHVSRDGPPQHRWDRPGQ